MRSVLLGLATAGLIIAGALLGGAWLVGFVVAAVTLNAAGLFASSRRKKAPPTSSNVAPSSLPWIVSRRGETDSA